MKQSTISDKIRLENIVERSTTLVNRLELIQYNKSLFSSNDFVRDAFIPPLVDIAENVKVLSADLAEKITDNQARDIISMRNRLSHAYISVDNKILWDTLITSIPKLGINTARVLEEDFGANYTKDINLYQDVLNKSKSNKSEQVDVTKKDNLSFLRKRLDNKKDGPSIT